MAVQLRFLSKAFFTKHTFLWTIVGVESHVGRQIPFLSKSHVTLFALEGLLS